MAGGGALGRRIEWALGIASALLVLAMTLYLVREGIGASDTLPDLTVAADPVEGAAPQVRFVIANRGGRAAQAVALALTLRGDDGTVERRRLVIDYVPARSEATGGFVLPPGAAGRRVEMAVEGYLDP